MPEPSGESSLRRGETTGPVVVVLSWHGRADTLDCVASLLDDPTAARVLVVDNGSFDGVLDEVARRWPEVATLQTGVNLGFAGGMNRGIEWALDRGASAVTVLNNDTLVPPGVIRRSVELARGRRAVSPEVRYRDRQDEIWFGGGELHRRLAFPHHTPSSRLAPPVDGVRATELLAGCCLTATAEVWREVGLFDERFFLNFEDSEWSLRAVGAGVELVVDTRSQILHSVSASFTGSASLLGTFYYVRNGLLFGRLAGGSALARLRFLRHRAVPPLAATARGGRPGEAFRRAVLTAWAIGCHLVRRYGVAPEAVQRLARVWGAQPERVRPIA